MRLTLFLALSLFLSAQSSLEVEITAEPHHRVILTNEQVRVFSVEVPPHGETLMHRHHHDYIFVTLAPSEVVNAIEGRAPIAMTLRDGDTGFLPGNFVHVVRNQSATPLRNTTIEVLQDAKLRQTPSPWDEDRGLDILQGGTRQILWVHDGIRASVFELQPGGAVPAHRSAGPQLFVAASELDLRSDRPLKSAVPIAVPAHFKSGDVTWLPAGELPRMTNSGHTAAKFVTLEFPGTIQGHAANRSK